jgi:hypothetical protein
MHRHRHETIGNKSEQNDKAYLAKQIVEAQTIMAIFAEIRRDLYQGNLSAILNTKPQLFTDLGNFENELLQEIKSGATFAVEVASKFKKFYDIQTSFKETIDKKANATKEFSDFLKTQPADHTTKNYARNVIAHMVAFTLQVAAIVSMLVFPPSACLALPLLFIAMMIPVFQFESISNGKTADKSYIQAGSASAIAINGIFANKKAPAKDSEAACNDSIRMERDLASFACAKL